MTKLATSVAFHSLGLAVAGEVVRATTLIAGSGTRTTSETTRRKTSIATTGNRRATPADTDRGGVRASSGQVAGLTAIVATAVGSGAAQAKGRAISLDVSQPLAVVALLGLGGTRQRTLVGLVAY